MCFGFRLCRVSWSKGALSRLKANVFEEDLWGCWVHNLNTRLTTSQIVQENRQDALTVRRRRKLFVGQQKTSSLAKIASRRYVDMVDKLTIISPLTKQIVQAELVNFKRHKNKRKWTLNDKLSALSIYKRSTRAYRFLRQYIILPS